MQSGNTGVPHFRLCSFLTAVWTRPARNSLAKMGLSFSKLCALPCLSWPPRSAAPRGVEVAFARATAAMRDGPGRLFARLWRPDADLYCLYLYPLPPCASPTA